MHFFLAYNFALEYLKFNYAEELWTIPLSLEVEWVIFQSLRQSLRQIKQFSPKSHKVLWGAWCYSCYSSWYIKGFWQDLTSNLVSQTSITRILWSSSQLDFFILMLRLHMVPFLDYLLPCCTFKPFKEVALNVLNMTYSVF